MEKPPNPGSVLGGNQHPGIGPIAATAILSLAPIETFAKKAGLRRLAWADTSTALDGRQAAARIDLEDGRAYDQAAADYRRQFGRATNIT
jgi:hypothetical protein